MYNFKSIADGAIVGTTFKRDGHIWNEVDVDRWDMPGENPDGTKNKFKTALKDLPRSGRIGFQNHGQVVWLKDIKIRTL